MTARDRIGIQFAPPGLHVLCENVTDRRDLAPDDALVINDPVQDWVTVFLLNVSASGSPSGPLDLLIGCRTHGGVPTVVHDSGRMLLIADETVVELDLTRMSVKWEYRAEAPVMAARVEGEDRVTLIHQLGAAAVGPSGSPVWSRLTDQVVDFEFGADDFVVRFDDGSRTRFDSGTGHAKPPADA